jgi:sugar phosphate isomerase/epimerase
MGELGIFSWFGYDLPLAERLGLIAEAGFASTCLWCAPGEALFEAGQADAMPALVREAGLRIDNIHAPYGNCNRLWAESDADASVVVAEYDAALSLCQRHAIPLCVVHLTSGVTPPPKNDAGLRRVRGLVDRAAEMGVVLAAENTRKPKYVDFVFANIDSPHLGFCYDSSHDFLPSGTRGAILERWGHRLVTTHLSDNHGIEDDHLMPGHGVIEWRLIADAFPKYTYTGPVMLEIDAKGAASGGPPAYLCEAYEKAVFLTGFLAGE